MRLLLDVTTENIKIQFVITSALESVIGIQSDFETIFPEQAKKIWQMGNALYLPNELLSAIKNDKAVKQIFMARGVEEKAYAEFISSILINTLPSNSVSLPNSTSNNSPDLSIKPDYSSTSSSDLSSSNSVLEEDFKTNVPLGEDIHLFLEAGDLRNALFHTVPSPDILTLEEEQEIIEAKKMLVDVLADLKVKKQFYGTLLLHSQSKTGLQIQVTIQKAPESAPIQASLTDIKQMCRNLQKHAMDYIRFLSGKAAKLLQAMHHERAEIEFKIAHDYAIEVYGPNSLETLKIQVDYGYALLTGSNRVAGQALLQETVDKLLLELATSSTCNELKKLIAIADYILAQYYDSENQFDKADQHVNRSERLRIEYGATTKELDKIRFLRGRIAFNRDNIPEALKLLEECYKFRRSQDELSSDLIPVLEALSNIMYEQNKKNNAALFLDHLLKIQKHLKINERQIIVTQLRILKAMTHNVSNEEYRIILSDVEEHLNTIPVTKESEDVGFNYMELAATRLSNFLPSEWSNVKKREYYSNTLRLTVKAESHLRAASAILGQSKVLREKCLSSMDFFNDPGWKPFVDSQLHPEDEAALALLSAQGDGENDQPLPTARQSEGKGVSDSTRQIMTDLQSSTPLELKVLSDFSSEVRHSLIEEPDRLLTLEDFELLSKEGIIDPCRLRAAQGGINSEFRNGQSLDETRQSLIDDPEYTKNIPPVEIGIHAGKVYSFDTRRLIVHQQAKEINSKIFIKYKKIHGEYLQQRVEAIFSPRPWNGIVTAVRYGGKGSESVPYVNPSLRSQLEEIVGKEFKPFPNNRSTDDDPNGFPIAKQKAKKIHEFLKEKKEGGSKAAEAILKEAQQIGISRGKEAAWDFLIKKKAELKNDVFESNLNPGKEFNNNGSRTPLSPGLK